MNGLNPAYVESVIRKAKEGKLTTGQAAAKLGVSKQYVNKLKRSYAAKGGLAFRHGNEGKERPWKTKPATEARKVSERTPNLLDEGSQIDLLEGHHGIPFRAIASFFPRK